MLRPQLTVGKLKGNLILVALIILLTAMVTAGGIFFLLRFYISDPITVIILSELGGLVLALLPAYLFNRHFNRPRTGLSEKIRKIGEGRFEEPIDLDREEIFSDIAESVNFANRNLMDKFQSIVKNTNRLAAVEEELSSRFRPRNSTDDYTKNLVYQLKICTSRLRNDLSDLSIGKSNGIDI